MNYPASHHSTKPSSDSDVRLYVEPSSEEGEIRFIAQVRSEFANEFKRRSFTPIPDEDEDNDDTDDDKKDDRRDTDDDKDRDDEDREWFSGDEDASGGCDIEDWDGNANAPKNMLAYVRAPKSKDRVPYTKEMCLEEIAQRIARCMNPGN